MSSTIILWIGVALLLAYFLKGKVKKPHIFSSGWELRGNGVPPLAITGDEVSFNFPTDPKKDVGHLAKLKNLPSLVGKKALTIRYTVTGGGFVPWESPDSPAIVGIIIQRKGDNMSGVGMFSTFRQYAVKGLVLEAGTHELTVPLEYAQFGPVQYANTLEGFNATLANPDNIGVIFGYYGGRAHGVFAEEPSSFKLLEIRVD